MTGLLSEYIINYLYTSTAPYSQHVVKILLNDRVIIRKKLQTCLHKHQELQNEILVSTISLPLLWEFISGALVLTVSFPLL